MTADLMARARAGDGEAFGQLVDPYRRELQVRPPTSSLPSGFDPPEPTRLGEAVWLIMPPAPLEYQGHELAARFLETVAFRQGRTYRLAATRANGQPAFGFYVQAPARGKPRRMGYWYSPSPAPGSAL